MEKAYHEALAAWLEDKEAHGSENGGESGSGGLTDPMPEKPKFKILKSNIKTLDKASDLVAKYSD
jgi:hypothetical protein